MPERSGRSSRGFARASFLFVGSLAAQRALPFLALPIAARSTSQEEYGLASISIAVSAVAGVALTMGINGAMPKLCGKDRPSHTGHVWVSLILLQVLFVAGVNLLGAVLLASTGTLFPAEVRELVVPTMVMASVSSLQMTYQGVAIARQSSFRLLMATLAQLFSGLTLVAILASAHGGLGYIFAMTLSSFFALVILASFKHPKPSRNRSEIGANQRLSIPFIGQGLATWLVSLSDRLIIGLYVGIKQVGGYQAAYMLGSVLGMLLEGVQAAWAPKYYKSTRPDKSETLLSLVAPSMFISSALALLLTGISPYIVPFIAPGYDINYWIILIVALASIPRAAYFVAIAKLLDEERTRSIMTATVVSAFFTIAMAFALIPIFGTIGGAVVTLAAFLIQSAIVMKRAFGWTYARSFSHGLPAVVITGAVGGAMVMSVSLSSVWGWVGILVGLTGTTYAVYFSLRRFNAVLHSWAVSDDAPMQRQG